MLQKDVYPFDVYIAYQASVSGFFVPFHSDDLPANELGEVFL